jgi:nucleoside-diphosphate-sugar epimerase
MKRIVVTGVLGGTGRSIAAGLRAGGYEVIGVDVLPPPPGQPNYVQLDLREASRVNDVFGGADGIVHFGSRPSDQNMSASEAFHAIAVAGFNVFQAAKNVGVKRIAWASSIEVYGDLRKQRLPLTEDAPLAPPSIYGSCKVLLETLARDFARWHGLAVASLRLTRIIYNSPEGVAKLKRLADSPDTGADCLWSYVDARDVASACQMWLESEVCGAHEFNLGADDVHHEVDSMRLLRGHGYGAAKMPALKHEHQSPLSSARIRSVLGWSEQYKWQQILRAGNTSENHERAS